MVGLSVLLTLLAATLSFEPRSGERLFQAMALPLNDDLQDLRPERLMELAMNPKSRLYQVTHAAPLDGAPDAPGSTFEVTVLARSTNPEEAARLRERPAEVYERIRQRFGQFDEMRLAEVKEVQETAIANKTEESVHDAAFRVVVQPTPVARRLWPYKPSLFFGAVPLTFMQEVPLGMQLYIIEDYLVNGIGAWVAVLVSVVITAFFIPNMLRKGTVDLLLVKPIHRSVLLLYKYIGGLVFIFLNTALAVLGIWLALGLRSGIWASGFLLSIFIISFFFAILYAVSTLFGVLTRSPIVAILLTCATWFGLFLVGALYQYFEGQRQQEELRQVPQAERTSENWFATTVKAVHFVLPRTKDLDQLTSRLLIVDLLTANQVKQQKIDDSPINWGESLTVSGIFIAVMLGLSCLWFATRDY